MVVLSSKLQITVQETPLLQVFNLDKLNYNNDRQTGGDGFMILSRHNNRFAKRIIFTKEPFGELLFSKLSNTGSENYNDASTYNPNQKKYVFRTCTVIRNLEFYKIKKTNSFKREV
jgi:cell surface protein SprA